MKSISILMQHGNETIFVMNMKTISVGIVQYKIYKLIQVGAYGLSLTDTCQRQANHPEILSDFKEPNSLSVEVKIYNDENFIKIHKYSTYLGVRLTNARIVFLKKNTNELICYLR